MPAVEDRPVATIAMDLVESHSRVSLANKRRRTLMARIEVELLVTKKIRGKKRGPGSKILVTKWVARAMLGSKPPQAKIPGVVVPVRRLKASKINEPKQTKKQPRQTLTMARLIEMGPKQVKAIRVLLKANYAITGRSYKDLLAKAAKVLDP